MRLVQCFPIFDVVPRYYKVMMCRGRLDIPEYYNDFILEKGVNMSVYFDKYI